MTERVGIILAGGSGKRLFPLTKVISKQLLPVYNKPMIYYPLSTLIRLKHKKIVIITTPEHNKLFIDLLGDGSNFGISIDYAIQPKPEGIAQALLIAEPFTLNKKVTLILGDNIFFSQFHKIDLNLNGGQIVTTSVENPSEYGVVEFNAQGEPIKIHEKPKKPPSNNIVTGIYFFDEDAIKFAKQLKPSARGELEITDINNFYLEEKKLNIFKLSSIDAWFDAGNYDFLLETSQYIKSIENKKNLIYGCPYLSAFQINNITKEKYLEKSTL